jgi:predicted nucleotidyltransferase
MQYNKSRRNKLSECRVNADGVVLLLFMEYEYERGANLLYTLGEISARVAPIAQKYDISAMYLFGSYARGDATEDSDIDILFPRQGSSVRGLQFGELYDELQTALGKGIDLVTEESLADPAERERSPWFIRSIMSEMVSIYEKQ